jgi:hypothetical protein
MTKAWYIVAGLVAGAAGVALAYELLKAKAITPTPTPTPTPTVPKITIDKTTYRVGENIIWNASGLTVGQTYIVGFLDGNVLYYAPSRDQFTASSPNATGAFEVGSNIAGKSGYFALCDAQARVLDKVPCTISLY